MVVWTACVALLVTWSGPGEAPSTPVDLQTYQEAARRAGRDPDAHLRLALWCEARGLDAERVKHLNLAVLADPSNAMARSLLGMVQFDGKWIKPDEIAARVRADDELAAALSEYHRRRETLADTADAHGKLGKWCDEHGLRPEAEAHFTAVTRLDPKRADAWTRLGFIRGKGRWVTPAQLAREEAERKLQTEGTARWAPRLESIKRRLGVKGSVEEARRELAEIHDPRVIPALWKILATGRPEHQRLAVQVLGQIDSPAAAEPLVLLAVGAKDPETRRAAGETLAGRDAREAIGPLVERIRTPVKYEVVGNEGPGGRKTLRVEGEAYTLDRGYAATPSPPAVDQGLVNRILQRDANAKLQRANALAFGSGFEGWGSSWTPIAAGQIVATIGTGFDLDPSVANDPVAMRDLARARGNREQYSRAVATVETQLRNDLAELETNNRTARAINDRILPLLDTMTGQELGDDRIAWAAWYAEDQGYSYQPPKKVRLTQQVAQTQPTYAQRSDCLALGTPVQTVDGPRPIESLRIGDRVLAIDGTTGGLSYQPILAVFHTASAPAVRLSFEGRDDAIVATPIHRFWKLGRGWTMARELKPGDVLRVVGGTVRVREASVEAPQAVVNLEVAHAHSYVAGAAGFVTHDHTLIAPMESPFDAPPAAEVLAGR